MNFEIDHNSRSLSRLELAYQTLNQFIDSGQLSAGTVLLEGPIADRLGMSRVPVRGALRKLAEEYKIHRFEGRGYLTGRPDQKIKPLRTDLQSLDWPVDISGPTNSFRKRAWQLIYNEVEEAITTLIPFDCYRVSEVEIARKFGVSRTVARETLFRLQQKGIVDKDRWSHWVAGPLTAQTNAEQYEIRRLLEPAALNAASAHHDRNIIQAMSDKVSRAIEQQDTLTVDQLEELELDLHRTCLEPAANQILSGLIKQNQIPLLANKIFHSQLDVADHGPMLREHALIFEHLLNKAVSAACESMEHHLQNASARTLERMKVLSILSSPQLPSYLQHLD